MRTVNRERSNPAANHLALDLAALRRKLSESSSGRQYWRSLEELAESSHYSDWLHREFPSSTLEEPEAVSRRGFLRMMGASLVMAGLSGCTAKPKETIVPYVQMPEAIVPGKPLFFATAMTFAGSTLGLLVETHEGRPTKIEGNPNHPASRGASDIFSQASLLSLYDPDRSGALTYLGDIRPWNALLNEIRTLLERQRLRQGAGLRLLTETVVSPTLAFQIRNLLREFPEARWHQYEPVNHDLVRQGSLLAFGRYLNTVYRVESAQVILSLDADFLSSGAGCVRYAREFASRRRPPEGETFMSRLYVVECTPSNTGTKADHRLPLRASEMETFARSLAAEISGQSIVAQTIPYAPWLRAVARDLLQHRGASLVIAGEQQPATVHAWVHRINHALGNSGSTVFYTEPTEVEPVDQLSSLRELVSDMDTRRVEWLVILGGNPVYDAPVDFDFAGRLQKVPVSMHLSHYPDETSALCQWHIPEAHYLEAWSDTRSFEGTASIVQPLIAPLWNGKSAHELLTGFTNEPERSGYDIVREYWKSQRSESDFERFWRKSLHDGVIEGTAFPPVSVTPKEDAAVAHEGPMSAAIPQEEQTVEIVLRPDSTIFDGRFANNGWLQELPKPITRLTWDNAALLSPATAEKLGLSYRISSTGGEHGQVLADVIELSIHGRSLRAPAWIVPGQADDCVILHLGYGRTRSGRVGSGTGFDAYRLRTSSEPWFASGAALRKTGQQFPLACVQFHHNMEGRELIHAATLEEFRQNSAFAQERNKSSQSLSLYPDYKYEGNAWGMVIDLNACVGCNACVVACQAENNIPVVGKTEVMRGREMHWIRIDQYHRGSLENPETYFQPVPCMQCENAPCEVVCPVGATVHSAEGLNDMVYNRCVGTRYCSNNCPYKVRRFNFFQYSDRETPSLKLMRNPNVTVRSRGVMEKCTYCVQRINAGRIEAEKENRPVRDGEIQTACQQACPAQAIIFGNINDRQSRVAQGKAEPRNYALLAELNTRPRTTYLAAVRNPNPEILEEEG
ncbi:MAG: TAT-variant-translocated molybdopterin oxidoreductase [Acidobacteria bacterium]|nr:TAT-variant-translocated molybdopterin oxidoreductase [Acidobacteriota bacterium]